jgi:hypothetical protein
MATDSSILSVRLLQVEFFQGPHAIKNFDLITSGGATSGAVSGLGQLYTWGQIKKVGESQVRHKDLFIIYFYAINLL